MGTKDASWEGGTVQGNLSGSKMRAGTSPMLRIWDKCNEPGKRATCCWRDRERAQWWTRKPEPALWCVTGPASIQGHMGALPRELWKECGSRKKKVHKGALFPIPKTGGWDAQLAQCPTRADEMRLGQDSLQFSYTWPTCASRGFLELFCSVVL